MVLPCSGETAATAPACVCGIRPHCWCFWGPPRQQLAQSSSYQKQGKFGKRRATGTADQCQGEGMGLEQDTSSGFSLPAGTWPSRVGVSHLGLATDCPAPPRKCWHCTGKGSWRGRCHPATDSPFCSGRHPLAVTVPVSACSALSIILTLSTTHPAAVWEDVHGKRVDLPHLPRWERWHRLHNALWAPVLPGLHCALGKDESRMRTVQEPDRGCQLFRGGRRWLFKLRHPSPRRVAWCWQLSRASSQPPGWNQRPLPCGTSTLFSAGDAAPS